ncbi:MAG TPA: hypothetical protein VGR63_10125 [Casimicrobiaceae bacterium]|nr:hypothetical protein [Casimicrobiaceae bacterium]
MGLAVTLGAFHPGLVTADSIAQYAQALAGTYADSPPPLMAWVWSRLLRVMPGAAGMLVLHTTLLWGGLLLIADGAARRGVRHAWLVIAVGFLPPVIGTAGEICNDVGMAASFVAAAGILYRASARGDGIGGVAAALALALLFLATAVRANAPAAAAPMLIWWAACVWPRAPWRKTCAIAAGVLALLLAAQWSFETRVLHAKRMHPAQMLEAFDLVAIRCAGNDVALPPLLMQPGATAAATCDVFDPVDVDELYLPATSPLRLDTDRSALRALAYEWRRAIVAHPGDYLAHRARAFLALLGFGVSDVARVVRAPLPVANPHGLAFTPNVLTAAIGAGVAAAAAIGLYNGLPWLAVGVGVLVLAWRRRPRAPTLETALAASALLYALAYFVVAIAPDYRYLYWAVLATSVAGALALLRSRAMAACTRRGLAAISAVRVHRQAAMRSVLAAAGFALTLVAYYPGQVTVDSIWQLQQGRTGDYFDHHPPLMAWLWSILDRAIPGPFGMLLMHALLAWIALLLFADGAARRGARHAWLIVALGFLPPIIGIGGEIWKDVGMAAALLFATALVFRAGATRARDAVAGDAGTHASPARAGIARAASLLALVPLFYATVVRANAPAATAPMLVYWARCTWPRMPLGRAIGVAVAMLALMLGGQQVIDYGLLDAHRAHQLQYLEAFDLAAIECAGGKAVIPAAFYRVAPDVRPLCERFDPAQVDFLFNYVGAPLTASKDPGEVAELGREWRRAIVAEPWRYLAHRLRASGALMGVGIDDRRRMLWMPYSVPNGLGFAFAPNALTRAIGAGVEAARAIGLYNGIGWLALAGIVIIHGVRRARRGVPVNDVATALAVSAMAYALPYFFVAIAPDYRYLYWTIIAAALGATLAVLMRPHAVSR